MNICLVLLSYGVWGGAEALASGLTSHLSDKGVNVTLVLNQEVFKFFADLKGVELINVGPLSPMQGWTKRNFLYRLACFPFARLSSFFYFQRIRKKIVSICQKKFDVINPILELATPLVINLMDKQKIPRVPVVSMIVGEPHLRGIEPTPLLVRPFRRHEANKFKWALMKSDRVIAMSNFMVKAWEAQGARFLDKAVVIIGGLNLKKIDNQAQIQTEGSPNLLFPGGSRFIKGGDLLIKALPRVKKEIPDVHLYVALDVPMDSILRKMVSDLGLQNNVTFVGFLPPKDYISLLNSVDMLVMPSRQDAVGGVFIEAMALGKPVIAANTGGTPEVVKEGRNGLLVELDPDKIAEAIIFLYKNEELRRNMSQNNIVDAVKYDWGNVINQYIEVYRQVSKS